MNNRMTKYEAPKGKVYDYKEPRKVSIKELDGTITETVEHLYAKYLFLGPRDSIESYILINDPKGE